MIGARGSEGRGRILSLVRWVAVLAIVGAVLAYPWPANGSASYPADTATLDSVAPENTSAIAFHAADHTIELGAPGNGEARVDLVHTRYSFALTGGLEVASQQSSPPNDWHTVTVTQTLPAGAAWFEVYLGAANGTLVDFASVEVNGTLSGGPVLLDDNFSSPATPWNLSGPAGYGSFGVPALRALQVATFGTDVGQAESPGRIAIPSNVTAVTVQALLRFAGPPGPFKLTLDVQDAQLDHLGYVADWGAWLPFSYSLLPLGLSFWSATGQTSVDLEFHPVDGTIGNLTLALENASEALATFPIGTYRVGLPVPFRAQWTVGRQFEFSIGLPDGTLATWSTNSTPGFPGLSGLVAAPETTVSAFDAGTRGSIESAVVSNATFTFVGSGAFTALAGNDRPSIVGTVAGAAVLLLLAPEWWPALRSLGRAAGRGVARLRRGPMAPKLRAALPALGAIAGVAALYGALALSFGGQPYDAWVFKVWTYSLQTGGVHSLYIRPEFVGDAVMRGGDVPWGTTGFAYGPLCAELFLGISRLVPPLSGAPSVVALAGNVGIGAEITWLLALATIAAAAVLAHAVRSATGRRDLAWAAFALLALNPAVVFDSAIWGETDSVLFLAVVLFAAFAATRPMLAMAVAGAAVAFKETGPILLLPAALLVFVPGVTLLERVRRVTGAVASAFLAIVPVLWAGLLPSVLTSSYAGIFSSTVVGGSSGSASVSPETYTVWTTWTGLSGGRGLGRMLLSSSTPLLPGVSYAVASLAVLALVWLALFVIGRRAAARPSLLFWLVATGVAALTFTALLTGTGSRYYTLGLPGLAGALVLLWPSGDRRLRAVAAAAYAIPTALSLWTMWGIYTVIMREGSPPIRGLALPHSALMQFVARWYPNDTLITIGSIGALLLVGLLLYLFRHVSGPESEAPTPRARPEGDRASGPSGGRSSAAAPSPAPASSVDRADAQVRPE